MLLGDARWQCGLQQSLAFCVGWACGLCLCAAISEGLHEQKSSSADSVWDVHDWRKGRISL